MTEWTRESLPPELVALHDAPGGTSLRGLAGILNAYDAMRAEPETVEWGIRYRKHPSALGYEVQYPESVAREAATADGWATLVRRTVVRRESSVGPWIEVGVGPDAHRASAERLDGVLDRLITLPDPAPEEPDPAAVYGGELTPPLCCCKSGLMCAACGTGDHWQCPDRGDADDEPDTAGGWFCNNSNCDCREEQDDDD